MKTIEEKARDFVKELPPDIKKYRIAIAARLIALLKEQDRDTRHACAEAVAILHSEDFEGVSVVGKDAAHSCLYERARFSRAVGR